MKKLQSILATFAVAAVAVVPVANAQTVHVVGAGSSAQFLGTMIGMSQLAANNLGGNCQYHFTKKSALLAHDNRDSLGRILDETGNFGIVWIASCGDTTGNTGITDVWLDGQYDSTLGVRLFSAQQKAPTAGPGATVYLNTGASGWPASDNLVLPNNLWADNKADVAIPANLVSLIGTASPGSLHVNMGLTDIRPEDALAATKRALAPLNTTNYAGLGYVGPTGQIGAPIFTAQSGSTSNLTPIGFGLSGAKDPINTAVNVPAYTTIPVGAAPLVFIYNNGGTFSSSLADLQTGIHGDGTPGTAGKYYLANLFDGTTSCDTHNKAFGGNGDGLGTPLTLFLREPLSGTENATEYTVFRTNGNSSDSQEKGVINPTRAPYNPLNLNCPTAGNRQRRVGNGQVLSAVNGTLNGLGYMFFSFANATTVNGGATNNSTHYQYFTLDGVDPLGLVTTNQELPYCTGTVCPSSLWPSSISFPTLRNGTYKAWSLYRWLNYNTNTDPLGPSGLATSIQDNIDSTVADFVPFETTSHTDGLEVYRSHFTQQGVVGNNGPATPNETLTNGNSLGGGTEAGGDEGGVVIGHDFGTVNTKAGTGTHAGQCQVTWKTGRKFGFPATSPNPSWCGLVIHINGVASTVQCAPAVPTPTSLYTTPSCGTQNGVSYDSYVAPTAPGTLNKKQ